MTRLKGKDNSHAHKMKHTSSRITILNVILGKSPGPTLRKRGRNSYTFEAQRKKCNAYFDYKYGHKKWKVNEWQYREVSASKDPRWPVHLAHICTQTKAMGATLAAASTCRVLRNRRTLTVIEDLVPTMWTPMPFVKGLCVQTEDKQILLKLLRHWVKPRWWTYPIQNICITIQKYFMVFDPAHQIIIQISCAHQMAAACELLPGKASPSAHTPKLQGDTFPIKCAQFLPLSTRVTLSKLS